MIHSTHRFHGRSSLRFVYQRGRVVRGELLSLRAAHNSRVSGWRAAVVVSRKVSKSAVVRNRIRRRVFETVRRQSARIVKGHDLVFSAYSDQLAALPAAELERAVESLMRRGHLLAGTSGETPDHGIVESKETL